MGQGFFARTPPNPSTCAYTPICSSFAPIYRIGNPLSLMTKNRPAMLHTTLSISHATPAHIPALIALLLTSFRQFPLFATLYSPLDENLEFASDATWFWTSRLQLELLDPQSSVIVAEIGEDDGTGSWESRARGGVERDGNEDLNGYQDGQIHAGGDREMQMKMVSRQMEGSNDTAQLKSWAMLNWVRRTGGMEQRDAAKGTETVGFAIWKIRGTKKTSNDSDIPPEVAAKSTRYCVYPDASHPSLFLLSPLTRAPI